MTWRANLAWLGGRCCRASGVLDVPGPGSGEPPRIGSREGGVDSFGAAKRQEIEQASELVPNRIFRLILREHSGQDRNGLITEQHLAVSGDETLQIGCPVLTGHFPEKLPDSSCGFFHRESGLR
ncbi:MAG: hypothetical protein IT335_12050 [Thermomicrobiales bacterium]|nr:hypothetical protein [Thermomicrobiales bacterium]